jgi:hypothetical protein
MKRRKMLFFVNFIRESEWIDGMKHRAKTIKELVLAKKPSGHAKVLMLLDGLADAKDGLMDTERVKAAHYLITSEWRPNEFHPKAFPKGYFGVYRKVPVVITSSDFWPIFDSRGKVTDIVERRKVSRRAPSWRRVPKLMDDWAKRVRFWQKRISRFSPEENARRVADFHLELCRIMPFAGGNGLVARAFAFYMLRYAGLKPFIFWEYEKAKKYYPCFGDKSGGMMREYFHVRIFHPESIMGRIETVSEGEEI